VLEVLLHTSSTTKILVMSILLHFGVTELKVKIPNSTGNTAQCCELPV